MKYLAPYEYVKHQWEQVEYYLTGVHSGEIITNEWIKLAVKRYRNDHFRDDLFFDDKKVNKVFEYYSLIAAETTEGVGQFDLLPFQAFNLAALYGFYWKETDKRKYKQCFLYMGRGNGKTGYIAPLQPYHLLVDGYNAFPEIVLVAHSRDQANRSFDALKQTILLTPDLEELLDFNNRQVYISPDRSLGFCETVPSKEASLQGYKLVAAILDEIHTYDNNKFYTAVKKGLNKKRNPMLYMLSTAGDTSKDFCKDQIEYSQKVLKGEIVDEAYWPLLYMPDEGDLKKWTNENVWYKSNPALGKLKDIEVMREDLGKAKYFPADKYDFLTYDLNVYTDSAVNWIPPEYLDKVLKAFEDERVKGRKCYIGADFSEIKDLSSIALLFPDEDGETFIAKIIYIFPDNAENLRRKGNVNLKYWIEEDHIIQCTKPIIDDVEILDLINEANTKYDVDGFGYDTRAGKKIAASIEQMLPADVVRPVQQGWGLSPAIKAIQVLVEMEKIEIDNNPVTKWNFANVVIEPDGFRNWRLNKKKSKEAIDGVVALCNAYKIWEELNYEPEYMASVAQLDYERNKE